MEANDLLNDALRREQADDLIASIRAAALGPAVEAFSRLRSVIPDDRRGELKIVQDKVVQREVASIEANLQQDKIEEALEAAGTLHPSSP